ncbi:MAG TPA: tetratricopeptide repeat protein [Terriglobales bacterium]|nr:tetratricopeptide repeat protein [Terriglobales bacterium]
MRVGSHPFLFFGYAFPVTRVCKQDSSTALFSRIHERFGACAGAALAASLLLSTVVAQTQTPRTPGAKSSPSRKTASPNKPSAPTKPEPSAQERLQQHYDAARTFQLSGDQEHAAAEFRAFLVDALRASANAYLHLNQSDKAQPLFEEALRLAPDSSAIRLDFASMLAQQGKLSEAQSQLEKILQASPDDAKAHAVLGSVLFDQGNYQGARQHLETAVVATPTFDVGYLLGITYIKLNDMTHTRLLFDDMQTGLGDTAPLHIMFGRAYGEGEWEALDNAILEFKKAVAIDPKAPQAHYFLALAHLMRDGEAGFPEAVPALQAEVKLNPNDARSHYLLGYIAIKQRDSKTAEAELLRAAALDPQNPDPLIYLGKLYEDAGRDSEAEAIMRKAIALTTDVSRNEYQINRAHYVLGRILLRTGRQAEGQKELGLSKELRNRLNRPDSVTNSASGNTPAGANTKKLTDVASFSPAKKGAASAGAAASASPEEQKQAKAFIEQIGPAIADSYNNLGVLLAGQKQYAEALEYFRKAGEWNPSLNALDRNWGMAAFYAKQYDQAIAPLSRQLAGHPDDLRIRSVLGLCFFMVQSYPKVLETLKPVETQVADDPGLAYAYAFSLVKTGEYAEGIRRLKTIAQANPDSAEIHSLLGQAFADQREDDNALAEYHRSIALDPNQAQTHFLAGLALIRQGNPAEAVQELRTALKLNPRDASTKYHLAFALVQDQKKDEAAVLLQEVIRQDPKYADAYYELGKLQLERGDAKSAISSLETGSRLSPDSDYIHYQLAMAYRRDARSEDAEREIKLYQALKNRHRGRDVPQTN